MPSVVRLNVVILSVVRMSVAMLSVVRLNVVRLHVVRLSVIAPEQRLDSNWGLQKLIGENLRVVWAEFSTLR
jgi:hypothetical protein